MASGYLHGVYTREVPTEVLPARVVDTNVVLAIGTAPVHTAAAGRKRPVNLPVLCYSYTEFVESLGWSDDWDAYTLCEVAESHFAKYGAAPVVCVNVFDPEKHTVPVEDEEQTFGAKETVTCAKSPVSGLVVKNAEGATTYAEGTDYTVDMATGVITRMEDGTIPAAAPVKLTYTAADPAAVTAADIIGGVDAKTLKKTGLELVDECFPRFRLVPGCILIPKFGELPGVAVAAGAKAQSVNGLFPSLALVDLPTDKVASAADAPGYKEKNNLTDGTMIVCWPRIKLGDRRYHISTQLAGRISLTDDDAGGTPHESPSNKRALMDTAVAVDADGNETEIWYDLKTNNYLNGQGIVTVNNFDGGWKFWGNRTAVYPSNTDPKDAFIPVRRFFNWYQSTFILTYFSKVDGPVRRRFVNTIIKSENIRLDGYAAREVIGGGRISFLEKENPATDTIDGLLRFHLWIAPPVPGRAIEGIFEFDPSYLQTLAGD